MIVVSPSRSNPLVYQFVYRACSLVEFTVKNTGKVAGAEVPQLYSGILEHIGFPKGYGEPPKQLRGFDLLTKVAEMTSIKLLCEYVNQCLRCLSF